MDIGQLLASGATVVDVRIMAEFAKGYATGSINILLDRLLQNLSRIPKGKPVVTCCASSTRSAIAATLLGDHTYDVDRNPAAAQAYRAQGLPTLAIFKKGAIVWRRSGAMSAAHLQQALAPFL